MPTETKGQVDDPNRPRFEVELTLRVWKTDKNGRRMASEPMTEFPGRWTDLDDAAVVALECAMHEFHGRLIQLGAAKALNSVGISDPTKKAYLQHVMDGGPVHPIDSMTTGG